MITPLTGIKCFSSLADSAENADIFQEEVIPNKENKIPQKCLVIGNSITLGFGTHGMASSDVDTDFYYLIKEYLTGLNPNFQIERVDGRPWESCTTTETRKTKLEEILADCLEEDTDLVIIQLGDNVNTAEKILNDNIKIDVDLIKYNYCLEKFIDSHIQLYNLEGQEC